jgi:hypothetical protein
MRENAAAMGGTIINAPPPPQCTSQRQGPYNWQPSALPRVAADGTPVHSAKGPFHPTPWMQVHGADHGARGAHPPQSAHTAWPEAPHHQPCVSFQLRTQPQLGMAGGGPALLAYAPLDEHPRGRYEHGAPRNAWNDPQAPLAAPGPWQPSQELPPQPLGNAPPLASHPQQPLAARVPRQPGSYQQQPQPRVNAPPLASDPQPQLAAQAMRLNNQQLQAQQRKSEDPHARGASNEVHGRVRQLTAVLDDHQTKIWSQAARDTQQTSAEIFNRSGWIADVSRGTRALAEDVQSVFVMVEDHQGKVDAGVDALGAQLDALELSHSTVIKEVDSLRSEQHRLKAELAQLPQQRTRGHNQPNLQELAAEQTTTPEQIQAMVNAAVMEQMHTMVQAGAAGAVQAVQGAAAESSGAEMREAVDAAVKAAMEAMEEKMVEFVHRTVADALAGAENPPPG